jgi:ABC-type multidrug transport system fused ATPase/permease subunit
MKKNAQKTQDELAMASSVANERFTNIRTVKSFAQEDREIAIYYGIYIKIHLLIYKIDKITNVFNLGKSMGYITASFASVVHVAGNFAVLAVLGYGGHLVLQGVMTIGDLTSFMLYSVYVLFASASISNFYADIMKTLGVADRIYEYLDKKPIASNISKTKTLPNIKGDILFSNVTFSYPTRPDSLIFEGFNLEVPNGKVIALVGPSGSGKVLN